MPLDTRFLSLQLMLSSIVFDVQHLPDLHDNHINHHGPYCHQNTSCCFLSFESGVVVFENIQVLKKNMAMLNVVTLRQRVCKTSANM